MSDPYRPAYYPPPTAGSPYQHQDYADNNDQYGPVTTHHRSSHSGANSGYYPQSQTQLTQSSRRDSREDDDDGYLSPERSHRHRSKSRHSRHHSQDDSDYDHDRGSSHRDRAQSHSRVKEVGATAVGGAAGALVGHKIGHGNIGTLAGLAVGALGARALEQQYEKREERKRVEEPFSEGRRERDRDRDRDGRPGTRERRKSFVEQAQEKVSGFLGVGDGKDKRRSRSNVGTSSGRERERDRRYEDSDSEDGYYEDKYDRRGSKEERYAGNSGRSRRDDYR